MTVEEILNKKVGFISLGCDKNRVDLENIIFNLTNVGFQIVNIADDAEIIVINTCAFLESSRLEAIENILEMSQLKNKKLEKLIVTGCLNELNYPDLKESLPEVDCFVNIKDNIYLVEKIFELYGIEYKYDYLNDRVLTTPSHYAYLKISDGCNNFCTYCLIPYIRGRFKSIPIEELLVSAQKLVDNGVKELILVAQDVTKYGVDLYNKKSLVELLQKLSTIDKLQSIRLLYCYPEEIDDNLIREIKNNDKILKYLDIPLQHVSNSILKKMNRRSTHESICSLFTKLKSEIPNIVIRTTFILGFPGETDDDFNQLLEFIETYKLNNVGFFKFSNEEGTKAYTLPNQIDEDLKQKRLEIASQLQYEIQNKLLDNLINKVYNVTIDFINDGYSIGRYYGQCPTIDSIIIINKILNVGQTYNVRITEKLDYDLKGELTYDECTK